MGTQGQGSPCHGDSPHVPPAFCPQVNREIVCGLRCLHLTYRRGRPGEWGWGLGGPGLGGPHATLAPLTRPSSPLLAQWIATFSWWAATRRGPRSTRW